MAEETHESNQQIIAMMMKMIQDSHEPTMSERVLDSAKKITDVAEDSKAIHDSYGNSLTAIGTDDKVASFTNYGFSNDTLNWPLWLALYNDSWVFKRAIDKPAQDEIRAGFTLQCEDENIDKVYADMKKYRQDLIQLLQWGALFGGSIAVLMLENVSDDEYARPIQATKLREAKTIRMYVVDRWYGVAPSTDDLVSDMNDIDFGKPKYYAVTFGDGKTLKVHHSYVLRYEHRTAPKLIKNGQLQGWGYAEGSHIINELSRDDQLKSSIQSLVNKSLIEVIQMSGMRGLFMGTDPVNQEQIRKRLEMVNWGRSYNSLTFLDKEDTYTMNHFSGLGGLADLLQQNMWLISSALEMQGILFGDLKGGFSQDAQALERYDETIQGRCEAFVRPIYEKLIKYLFIRHNINEKVEFTFNSLLEKEQNEAKLQSTSAFAQLCSSLLNDGVIDLKQYGKALQLFTTKGVIDFGLTDEAIEKLDDKMEEQFEGMGGMPGMGGMM